MTILENIDNGKYRTKLSYDFIPEPIHDDMTVRQARETVENNRKNKVEWRLKWRADVNRLETEVFREDLAKEYGLVGHPKEWFLWEKCWEYGHSSGLTEVLHWYEDLSELITSARSVPRPLGEILRDGE